MLAAGSVASLAANVAVAEPTSTGRVIAAWPSFALIASYELLMRQVRKAGEMASCRRKTQASERAVSNAATITDSAVERAPDRVPTGPGSRPSREVQLDAWHWAQENRAGDGSLPSGRDIARAYGRHERWGRLVKQSGLAGDLGVQSSA